MYRLVVPGKADRDFGDVQTAIRYAVAEKARLRARGRTEDSREVEIKEGFWR